MTEPASVTFTAACPSCGKDATWTQRRATGVTPSDFEIDCPVEDCPGVAA